MEEEKTKEKIEKIEEPMEEDSKHPAWCKVTDDYVKVKTKDGVFTLEDVEYDRVMRAKQRVTRGENNPVAMDKFELALIAESMTGENKVGDMDLRKMKTSTVMRLRYAVSQLYDIQSFL